MSFREKSAWITLVTVLVCFGVYYGGVVSGGVHRGLETIHLLLLCVGALVVLQVALHVIAARLTPRADRAARDEREALIQARSHTVGYYVLVACVLALGIPGHMGHGTVDMLNFALLGVVIAALTVSAAQIVMFRRGV
jgi:cytochrome bd-type quinol oxidase subunit 2